MPVVGTDMTRLRSTTCRPGITGTPSIIARLPCTTAAELVAIRRAMTAAGSTSARA